jgi:predicted PurR-regulated permease PerM
MTDRETGSESRDLTRTTLQLVFLGALIGGIFWILRPFLMPIAWAATIVVATWPVVPRLQHWLGGRRGLAVAVMTAALLLVLIVPLYIGISTIAEHATRIVEWTKTARDLAVPPPPDWLAKIPLIGATAAAQWQEIAAADPADLSARVLPYARTIGAWSASKLGGIGMLFVQFLITVGVAALLYGNGEYLADRVSRFARRLAGAQGDHAVQLAAQAVRAVALGVVATAAAQAALGGIGLAVVGVPFAAVLTAVMFVSGVVQAGPVPVLLPAVIWVYARDGAGSGTALLIWSLLVSVMDNVLRPLLIKRGADIPLLVILAGVIGGLIAFGVIGLFVGPVVLAIAYTLLDVWLADERPATRSERDAA